MIIYQNLLSCFQNTVGPFLPGHGVHALTRLHSNLSVTQSLLHRGYFETTFNNSCLKENTMQSRRAVKTIS